MDVQDQADLLIRSGLFNAGWYCRRYPDVGETGMDPVQHYLRYGWVLGRDPGPEFDATYYCTRYPDIAQNGVNPVLHYLWQGQAEGRLPTPHAERVRLGIQRVRKLQAELWGGLGPQSETALQTLCDTPDEPEAVRFEAGCQLMAWLDFNGQEDRALACLERMGGMSSMFSHAAARLIPMSVLYARRRLVPAAQAALNRITQGDCEADRRMALANLDPEPQRLDRVNSLYEARGLAPVILRDPARPLGLDNLTTAPLPVSTRTADMGKVSVIVPAYKAAAHIETALRGLCAQTHADLEIIVVDDASPDDTYDRILALAAQDSRIIPLRQSVNGGAYAARNRGLAAATGAFVTTHDADDWSHPQKIAWQLQELAAMPQVMGVMTHWARVRPPFSFTTNWRLGPQFLQWSHSSLLMRREVPDSLGGWDEVRMSADMEYIWRIEAAFGHGSVQRLLPDIPMAFALDDAASLTRNPDTHVRTTYQGLRHYYREICRYWHRQAPKGLTSEQQARKMAMLPGAMLPDAVGGIRVDLLIQTDCSDPTRLSEVARKVQALPGEVRIGLSHRPAPDFNDRPYGYAIELADRFFELLEQDNIQIACPETQVQAGETIQI